MGNGKAFAEPLPAQLLGLAGALEGIEHGNAAVKPIDLGPAVRVFCGSIEDLQGLLGPPRGQQVAGHAGGSFAPAQVFRTELAQITIHIPPGDSDLQQVGVAIGGALLADVATQQLQSPIPKGVLQGWYQPVKLAIAVLLQQFGGLLGQGFRPQLGSLANRGPALGGAAKEGQQGTAAVKTAAQHPL